MSMSVTSLNSVATPVRDGAANRIASRRDGYSQMSDALQSGDIDAAKSAYATVVRNAPPGATMQPGSPMAQLGKALASGNLGAAQSTWNTIVQNHQSQSGNPVDTNPTIPTASSTGGVAGSTLSVSA